MKYFINPTDNAFFGYEEDGSQDGIIPSNFIAATPDQLAEFISPTVPAADLIKIMIANLEATITPRRMREATLTVEGKAWLADIDAHIASLRAQISAV